MSHTFFPHVADRRNIPASQTHRSQHVWLPPFYEVMSAISVVEMVAAATAAAADGQQAFHDEQKAKASSNKRGAGGRTLPAIWGVRIMLVRQSESARDHSTSANPRTLSSQARLFMRCAGVPPRLSAMQLQPGPLMRRPSRQPPATRTPRPPMEHLPPTACPRLASPRAIPLRLTTWGPMAHPCARPFPSLVPP